MGRAGITDFMLLHGVRKPTELYYRNYLEAAASHYIPCISSAAEVPDGAYAGRVTDFIETELPQGEYDFYLCGGGEMIHDVILLVDDHFEGSRVFTEKFY